MYHYPIPTGLGLQQLLLICDKLDFTMDKWDFTLHYIFFLSFLFCYELSLIWLILIWGQVLNMNIIWTHSVDNEATKICQLKILVIIHTKTCLKPPKANFCYQKKAT
jgi:hypothetical protein